MVEANVHMVSLCQWEAGDVDVEINLRNVQRRDGLSSDAKLSSHLVSPLHLGLMELCLNFMTLHKDRKCT